MYEVPIMDKKTVSKSSEFIDSLIKSLLEMRGHSEDDATQYKKIKKELQEVFSLLEIELILCPCGEDDLLIPTHDCEINTAGLN